LQPIGRCVRLFVLLLCAQSVAACATPDIDKSYVLSEQSGKGVAIGSITYHGRYSLYRVYYRKVGTTDQAHFGYGQGQMPPLGHSDIDERRERGDLFAAELPAGDYEIFNWRIDSGPSHITAASPFMVRFTVAPGKAVYLGNFFFEATSALGFTTTGSQLDLRDRSERDLKIFADKYPGLAKVEVGATIEPGRSYANLGGGYNTNIQIPIILPLAGGKP
jgi:hypothetical protein